MSFDDHLARTASRLVNSPEAPSPSDTLERRVMQGVYAENESAVPRRANRPTRLLPGFAGLAVITAFGWSAFASAHHFRFWAVRHKALGPPIAMGRAPIDIAGTPAGTLAISAHTAVDHVKTWHFEGWKETAAGRKRWEIWGRLDPPFYREDIGDEFTFDDGKKRVELCDNSTAGVAGTGAVTLAPLTVLAITPWSRFPGAFIWQRLAQIMVPTVGRSPLEPQVWQWLDVTQALYTRTQVTGEGRAVSVLTQSSQPETGAELSGNRMAMSLTIDEKTHLPIEFDARRLAATNTTQRPNRPFEEANTEATLIAHYNVDIPQSITSRPATPGVPVVNESRLSSTAIAHDISLQPVDIRQNDAGDIRATVRMKFIDGMDRDPVLTRFFHVVVLHSAYAADDDGALYLLTMMTDAVKGQDTVVWLAPLVPHIAGHATPKHITLHLPIQIQVATPTAGPIDEGPLNASQEPAAVLTLPQALGPLPLPAEGTWNYAGPEQYSLNELDAVARATYYGFAGGRPEQQPPFNAASTASRNQPVAPVQHGRLVPAPRLTVTREDREQSARWWTIAAEAAWAAGDITNSATYKSNADRVTRMLKPRAPSTGPPTVRIGP